MSSVKKLCIATGIFPPDTGGPSKFAESFASWAKSQDKNISFISLTDGPDSRSDFFGFNADLISRDRSFLTRFFKTVGHLVNVCRSNQMILANGLFIEVLIASLLSRKVKYCTKVPGDIVWERARNSGLTNLSIDAFQDLRLPIRWKLFRALFSASLKRSNLVIVPSAHLYELCISWGIDRSSIHIIHNSVDTNLFASTRSVKKWDVVTVCRLVPWKGVDEIIKVCAELDLSLCVVGDGPERASLESLAGELKCNAEFQGNRDQGAVRELLSSSKYFVLNSNFEATSYALIEARASGLPSIARRNTGSEEVITHNFDGYLCDENMNLMEALRRLSSDSILSIQMSERALEDAKVRFDVKRNFQLIYNLVMRGT